MIRNVVLEVAGQRWLVTEAASEQAALNEIAMARVTGSVGSSSYHLDWETKQSVIRAEVHRINSDDTKQKPYTTLY